jgi:hypothetical protein
LVFFYGNQQLRGIKKKGGKMNKPTFSDVTLTCCDCNETFLFSAGEQAFFASKALSPPKRCPTCRSQRKQTIVPDVNSWPHNNGLSPINDNPVNGGSK